MIKKGDDTLDRQNPCDTAICTQQIAVSHG